MTSTTNWYQPQQIDEIDTPALIFFPDRIQSNIDALIKTAGSPDHVRPHVKTHKQPHVVKMHLKSGITAFKCATIAEATMLAQCGVTDILLAYQPVGPKQRRLIDLVARYPHVTWGCLVDNLITLEKLNARCAESNVTLNVWLDVNNGMARTGIQLGQVATDVYAAAAAASHLRPGGLHVYDGHFRGEDVAPRQQAVADAFQPVDQFVAELKARGLPVPAIVSGGSHSFSTHAQRPDIVASPGTYSLWDAHNAHYCPELPFIPAAIIATRIISKPADDRVCLDMGHKSIAAENPIDKRIQFLNVPQPKFLGQSEEHLVVQVPAGDKHQVGDVWYGVPWHICPTVALYESAFAIWQADPETVEVWPIVARDRYLD